MVSVWTANVARSVTDICTVPIPAKPFQVITGVGHHSPGYVGVLLPAMSNMLERNGWRVDRGPSGRGYLMVRGRAR